jgi:peptide/nickel transport system substrate-binding protein
MRHSSGTQIRWLASACGVAAVLALSATNAPAQTPVNGGTLVVALPGDIQRTDAALTDDTNSAYVMNQVMEGLVGLKPGSRSEIVPVLSSGWTVSPDGKTYTFQLRKGIKFHDGTDFDANAVKYNYDRWLKIPDSYSKLQYTYFIDVAVKPVVDSVTVTSPTEVVITLKAPNSAFLTTQTLPPFFIASPKALEAGDASDPDFSKNTYAQGGPTAMVGTGPFKFKEWVPGDHVLLVKNPDYWDQAHAAHLDALKFQTNFPNSTATLNALQSGGVDVAQTLAPIDSKAAAGDANLQAIDRGGSCNLFELAMNQKQKPFDNVKLRQAAAYAINKQALVAPFYAGQAVLADNWMPEGLFGYKALHLPTYDPAKAKALIAESGVSDLSFDFWYPSNVTRPYMPDPKGEFQAILSDLEAVGFKPNPKTSTWNPDYLTGIGGQYPMYLLGLTCDWAGPDNFLMANLFGYKTLADGSFGPNPRYNEKNDALQKAMEAALGAPNDGEAVKHWQEAQDMLAADMPAVPILSSNPPAVAQKYVQGFVPSASLTEFYNTVWIAPH